MDKRSKTDSFAVLFQKNKGKNVKLGQTEMIADSLNPEFVTSIEVDYFFEESQNFLLEVYDCDNANLLHDLSK